MILPTSREDAHFMGPYHSGEFVRASEHQSSIVLAEPMLFLIIDRALAHAADTATLSHLIF